MLVPENMRFLLAGFCVLFLSCYSTEFRASADYPVLRKSHPQKETELLFRPPVRPHDEIGMLYVYDAALDLQDPGFRDFLKQKIHDLGADGAYVQRVTRKRRTMLQAQTIDASNHVNPTGKLEMDVGTLRLLLYCYRNDNNKK